MAAKRVMILEDIQSMRDILSEVVEAEGHEVVYAGAGPDCVQRVLDAPPELLFLNLSLKTRLGFDVYAALRADPRTRALPIVLVTVQRSQTVSRMLGISGTSEDPRLKKLYQPFAIADAIVLMRQLLQA